MSEEKIQLPDFLIAELYKGSLVELETFEAKVIPPVKKEKRAGIEEKEIFKEKIKFLGENGKGVIIIVNQPNAVFLKEDELTFLTNILKACQLNLADIAIINNAKQPITYEVLKEQLTASTILLFDVEPSAIKLPFMIPPFQVQKFDGSTVMVSPALPVINQPTADGKLLKTKLWMSLRKVFNIA
jgi:hypothetical protein